MSIDITLFGVSIFAGTVGALLGLGGGVIIIPTLTLYYGIDMKYAIPVSLIATVATSLNGTVANFKKDLVNIRVATVLETATIIGAIYGFLIAGFIAVKFLYYIFGSFLILSAFLMLRKRKNTLAIQSDPIAKKLQLNADYEVQNVASGFLIMSLSGVLSALLGVGGGILKTVAMDSIMKIPIKSSSATSNFMIGVTSSTSALGYLIKGDVAYSLVPPIVLGITIGSHLGSKLLHIINPNLLRHIFVIVLILISIQMILKGSKL